MSEPIDELGTLQSQGLLRRLTPRTTDTLPFVSDSKGQRLINFSSNDYLGLSQHPTVIQAAITAVERYGVGATASRLVCGSFDYHHELETQIASLKETSAARIFANGYATALGTIPAVVGKNDTVILDKLAHASLIDGAKLSQARLRTFPHNKLSRLEELLRESRERAPHAKILIVTESVFSMDGDCCPLREMVELKDKYEALLLLDEAHALGVLGPRGLGLAEALGLQPRIDFQMGTLGKAAGSAGGYLAAKAPWIDLLTNRARSFIYSTAPPPAQIAAAMAALTLITSEEGQKLREQLQQNITLISPNLEREHHTAIIPLILGSNENALAASENLRKQGILVPAIRYPTVPRDTARLRITVSAKHQPSQLAQLRSTLLTS